eukprot:COSAG02_NODE_138_length_34440_cov_16.694368_3_plen_104_part_00
MLIFGAKRWALLPPSIAQYSTMPAKKWFSTRLPELIRRSQADDLGLGSATNSKDNKNTGSTVGMAPEVVQCVQRSGEAIYVPEGWGHAVLNLLPRCATLRIHN